MKTCLFCDIIQGTEPSVVLYRDAICSVILDVYPMSEGHALVLPNRHVVVAAELSTDEFQHLMAVWHSLRRAYVAAGIAVDGANLLLNDGQASNQHVPHLHIHLIPRAKGDSAKALLMFVGRMVNLFGGRKSVESLQGFAARLAPFIAQHVPPR